MLCTLQISASVDLPDTDWKQTTVIVDLYKIVAQTPKALTQCLAKVVDGMYSDANCGPGPYYFLCICGLNSVTVKVFAYKCLPTVALPRAICEGNTRQGEATVQGHHHKQGCTQFDAKAFLSCGHANDTEFKSFPAKMFLRRKCLPLIVCYVR